MLTDINMPYRVCTYRYMYLYIYIVCSTMYIFLLIQNNVINYDSGSK